jgi:hypothetical protein
MANLPAETVATPLISLHNGGRGGIRTHGTLAGTPVFKTGALNHSATLPTVEIAELFHWQQRTKAGLCYRFATQRYRRVCL